MLGGGAYSTTTQGIVENIDKTPQIKYYNYAPNTIKVVGGSDTINFNYTPSVNSTAITTSVEEYTFPTSSDIDPKYVKNIDARAGQTIAYEYVFGNAMNRASAVNLKSIGDTTGVTVSYWWQTTPLTQGEAVTNSPAKFTCQEMANKDDTIYLYVIVSSESSTIPADFTTDIVWYYGVPYDMPLTNNIGGTNTSIKLVKGQAITEDILPTGDELLNIIGKADAGYYFDAWFTDSNYTKIADLTSIKAGNPLYPRFHNIPTGVTTYFTYADGSYRTFTDNYIGSLSMLSGDVIIPTIYDDGVNGKAPVVDLGYSAFFDDMNWVSAAITSVSISSSVTSIENWAFRLCRGLTSVTIPSSVTSINMGAFEGCSGLTNIVVQAGNPVYDSRGGCSALIETATNTLLKGSSTTIIPNTVTSIGGSAFTVCSSLTSITIPSSVTSIGDDAFHSCSSLTSIDLSNCTNLTSIGSSAFQGCSSLTSITIPSSVNSIETYTFYGCSSLTSITVPASVSSITYDAFWYCSSLTSIIVEAGNPVYDSRNNCNAIIETATNALIIGCSTTIIPNTVTSIGNYAFHRCNGLTSITIPSSVTSIGSYAFGECSNLTSITFEDPTTWYRTNNSTNWANKTGGTQTDVSVAGTAATYLKSTYKAYYWYKL